jgi:ubiquitin C-terminal hydrolase
MIEINSDYESFGSDPKDVVLDFIFTIHKEINGDNSFELNNKLNKLNKFEVFGYYKGEDKRTSSIISSLFGYCKQTTNYCSLCRIESYDFIYEFYITFSLKKIYESQKDIKKNNSIKKLNINDCFLNHFNKKDNKFNCPSCKQKVNGISYKKICVLPKYLIIILDRGKDDKFNCHVDFDYTLELNEVTEQIENEKYNTKYELIGATFLLGSSGAGHTVAYCKHFDGKYYLFNDNTYKQESLNKFKNNKVFLLFYERKN